MYFSLLVILFKYSGAELKFNRRGNYIFEVPTQTYKDEQIGDPLLQHILMTSVLKLNNNDKLQNYKMLKM